MFRRLLSVGGFTLLSRITGFARDIVMAWILGKGILSDAFIVAFLFPSYFRAIFGEGTINPAFLPRYAARHARGEQKAAAEFADNIMAWQLSAQFIILAVALVAMPFIARLIAPGFAENPGQLGLTVDLMRITFPYLILTVVVVQLSAMLNAVEKFWAAAAWSNFLNIGMIVALLAHAWFPNAGYAAAWGVLGGGVAQLVFMLWAGRQEGVRFRIVLPRWNPETKEFFKAFCAVTFGAASVVIAPFIDTILASYLETGSRTALYYADRINQLPLGVLGIAIGTVLLPEMSTRLARGDRTGSDTAQNNSAATSLLLTLPFAFVFVAIPDTIMRAIFAHGAFDHAAANHAALALAAYGVGLPAMALVRIVASTFYARHDTVTPARATVIAIVSNIVVKAVLVIVFDMGIAGIALGTALGAWINVLILTWTGRSRLLLAIEKSFLRSLPPSLIAACAAGAAAWGGVNMARFVMPGDVAALAAAIICSAIAYVGVVFLFRNSLPLGWLRR